MLRIARESAALLDAELSNNPNDFLYDEMGMPK
jgi:hypothetical protein